MSKKQIDNRQTNIAINGGVGQHFEQIVTIDDNPLPAPQELAEYNAINPRIVEYLVDTAKAEQSHRQKVEEDRVGMMKDADHRTFRMNWWGMFFAFLSLVTLIGLSAFALYLNRPWFAGILSFATVVSIMSLFVTAGTNFNTKTHNLKNTDTNRS